MYNPQRELNHIGSVLSKLLEQYKNKPLLAGLLISFLNRCQEAEDAAWEVIYKRNIDGIGAQLDVIGKIVGRGRNGLGDTDYRIALRAQIKINLSHGTPEDMLAVASLSTNGAPIIYSEQYPAQTTILVHELVSFNIGVLYANLVATKPEGVRLLLEFSPSDPSVWFTFAPSDATVVDNAKG